MLSFSTPKPVYPTKLRHSPILIVWCLMMLFAIHLIKPSSTHAASLSLNTDNSSIFSNQSSTATITLNPEGQQVIGTDIFLQFDPRLLRLDSITSTNAFSSIHAPSINNQTGRAKFALTNQRGDVEIVSQPIATINFTALTTGTTNLSFISSSNSTTDTNIVINGGQDVLTSTTPLTLTISNPPDNSPTSTPATATTPSPTSTPPTPTPTIIATSASTQTPTTPQSDSIQTSTLQEDFVSPTTNAPANHPNNPQVLGLSDTTNRTSLNPNLIPTLPGSNNLKYLVYLLIATNIAFAVQIFRLKQARPAY